jgi:hypothetical protein
MALLEGAGLFDSPTSAGKEKRSLKLLLGDVSLAHRPGRREVLTGLLIRVEALVLI